MNGKIEALYLYPVKSCAGVRVEQAELSHHGLIGDRRWMIVDEKGLMMTQRKLPALALIQPSFEHGDTRGQLQLRYNPTANIHSNIAGQDEDADNSCTVRYDLDQVVHVSIWQDKVPAFKADAHCNQWLNRVLNTQQKLSLVYYNPDQTRHPGEPQRFGDANRHFADAAPYLVCNHASLTALNQQLAKRGEPQVSMLNFRPNIVVGGVDAFSEHGFSHIQISEAGRNNTDTLWRTGLYLVDHCQRCAIITIDPQTAQKYPHAVPFKALTALNPMPSNLKAPAFGINAVLKTIDACALTDALSNVEHLSDTQIPIHCGQSIRWR